jgi:2-dehydro-3-deoxygalactonokinase
VIAVDWGGTSLRVYRLDEDGAVCDSRRADAGALNCGGRFAGTLAAQIHGWDDEQVVLCGMVGARGGWHEVPYVECPADTRRIAAGMLAITSDDPALSGRTLRIVPGVIDRRSARVADVMRGEETQIAGLLHLRGGNVDLVCLPGTHSKWVRIRAGAIASLQTAMTGELHALLRTHGILARLMESGDTAFDAESFDAGVRRSNDAGGLLHHLFGVRTQGLLGQLTAVQAPSYLSGLLIGHEIGALAPAVATVQLIASERLALAYSRALASFGIEAEIHSERLAAAGMHALARAAR